MIVVNILTWAAVIGAPAALVHTFGNHTWRGLHRECPSCHVGLRTRVLGWYHYAWCDRCATAQICEHAWWRAPWAALIRFIKIKAFIWHGPP